jgi:hypothetical protein
MLANGYKNEKGEGRNLENGPNRKVEGVGGYTDPNRALAEAKTTSVKRGVLLSENRKVVGDDHGKTRLSDTEVERMRDLFEAYPEGHPQHLGYRALGKMFNCSKRTARDICNYSRRNTWAAMRTETRRSRKRAEP